MNGIDLHTRVGLKGIITWYDRKALFFYVIKLMNVPLLLTQVE